MTIHLEIDTIYGISFQSPAITYRTVIRKYTIWINSSGLLCEFLCEYDHSRLEPATCRSVRNSPLQTKKRVRKEIIEVS